MGSTEALYTDLDAGAKAPRMGKSTSFGSVQPTYVALRLYLILTLTKIPTSSTSVLHISGNYWYTDHCHGCGCSKELSEVTVQLDI